MGYSNSEPQFLVVMTNKDVYYVTDKEADEIAQKIVTDDKIFSGYDARSIKRIRLQIKYISSIVEGDRNA